MNAVTRVPCPTDSSTHPFSGPAPWHPLHSGCRTPLRQSRPVSPGTGRSPHGCRTSWHTEPTSPWPPP